MDLLTAATEVLDADRWVKRPNKGHYEAQEAERAHRAAVRDLAEAVERHNEQLHLTI